MVGLQLDHSTHYKMLSIAGLVKLEVLKALWLSAQPVAFFAGMPGCAPDWDEAEGKRLLSERNGYVDYAMGRNIKMDFSKDTVDPRMYDRDAGAGTAARIIASLHSGTPAPKILPSKLVCPGQTKQQFEPWGEAMLPGKPDTIMCAHCGRWKSQHEKA